MSFFFLSFCFGMNLNHDSLRCDSFSNGYVQYRRSIQFEMCICMVCHHEKLCYDSCYIVVCFNLEYGVPRTVFMFNIESNILQCILNDVIHHQTSNVHIWLCSLRNPTNEKVRLKERNNNSNNNHKKKQITQ